MTESWRMMTRSILSVGTVASPSPRGRARVTLGGVLMLCVVVLGTVFHCGAAAALELGPRAGFGGSPADDVVSRVQRSAWHSRVGRPAPTAPPDHPRRATAAAVTGGGGAAAAAPADVVEDEEDDMYRAGTSTAEHDDMYRAGTTTCTAPVREEELDVVEGYMYRAGTSTAGTFKRWYRLARNSGYLESWSRKPQPPATAGGRLSREEGGTTSSTADEGGSARPPTSRTSTGLAATTKPGGGGDGAGASYMRYAIRDIAAIGGEEHGEQIHIQWVADRPARSGTTPTRDDALTWTPGKGQLSHRRRRRVTILAPAPEHAGPSAFRWREALRQARQEAELEDRYL